jgi:hypothetical protein
MEDEMNGLRGRLSYANVVSTLCLFLVLGGGAYAATKIPKNAVGTAQLKNGSVTGQKVAANTLTGANIDASTLGTVRNATHAASADSAGTASHAASADSAGHAGSADSAGHATSADSAANASQLGGSPPSAYRDSCPSGTKLRTPALCESTSVEGHVTYTEAIEACAARSLRLPSPSEAESLKSSIYAVWTDDFWTNGPTSYALYYIESTHGLHALESGEEANVDCVTTPIDN